MIALAISAFVYIKTKNIRYVFLCLFVSFAIDLDHLFDYWMAYGLNFNHVNFLRLDFFYINKKVFVPFHSWELISLIFILSATIRKYRWLILTIGLAMLGHVLWDAFSYRIAIEDYSLVYRAARDFQVK